jgi:hypothetical protein
MNTLYGSCHSANSGYSALRKYGFVTYRELQYHSSKIRLRPDETRINVSSTPNHFPDTLPIIAIALNKVFGLSPAEIVGSNPTGGMDVCLL